MSNLIGQLAQQFGLGESQTEAGAGAVLKFLQEQAGGADLQQLIAKVPGAESWIAKADQLPADGAGDGGGLLGQAAGLLGSMGGAGLGGLGQILGQLQSAGLSADSASQFVPALLEKLQGEAGSDLLNSVLEQVPALKGLMGGEGGAGALGGMLGKFLK